MSVVLLDTLESRNWTYGARAARVGRLASAALDRVVHGRDSAQDVFETSKVVRGCDGRVVRRDFDHAVSTHCEEVRERNSAGPDGSHLAREESS